MDFTLSFLKLFFWEVFIVGPLFIFLIAIIIALALIVTAVEKWNKFDGLYWALITATTVGYGDIRPLKKISKALSIIIALIGMMFTGLMIAITINTATVSIDKHLDQSIIEKIKKQVL